MSTPLIEAISYYLPEKFIDVEALQTSRPEWNIAETLKKTGVKKVRRSEPDETTVDLAYKAAEPLISRLTPHDLPDTLLFCTQTPDFMLPHCSAILQDRLGLPTSTCCFDIGLGCSGYVYGLGIASGLLRSGFSRKVLLVTAENYSKIINEDDKKTFLLFSDAAAATLLASSHEPVFTFGTDGSKHESIIFPQSGVNRTRKNTGFFDCEISRNGCFEMDGYGIFLFTLGRVSEEVTALLEGANLSVDDIDHFVFHQGSLVVLESLQRKLKIPGEKVVIDLAEVGNAASASIPVALKRAEQRGRIKRGDRLCLFGFGIGLSWAGAVFRY